MGIKRFSEGQSIYVRFTRKSGSAPGSVMDDWRLQSVNLANSERPLSTELSIHRPRVGTASGNTTVYGNVEGKPDQNKGLLFAFSMQRNY